MMMKSRLLIAAAFVASLFASGAQANYVVKDGNGVIQTIQAGVIGGNILPYMSLTDQTGVAFGTVGNPLAIQFGAGITLPSFTVVQHFICDSGCGGGGGGGGLSVPFFGSIGANGTPTGYKDASGNFQPFLGDVTNGQWVNIKSSITIPISGTVTVNSIPIPTGASTSALQGTNTATTSHTCSVSGFSEIGCLGQIDDDIRGPIGAGSASIGTVGLNAGSNTVGFIGNTSFAATQATASALNATVVGTGTFAVQATQAGSWTATVTQATGSNLHMVCDSGCSGSSSPSFGSAFPATGTPIGMTQGGNLTALSGTGGSLNVNVTNTVPVSLTSTTITGSVAVTGTFFQATQPISATALPLPTGAATQTTSAAILAAIGTPFQAAGALGAGSAIIGNIRVDQTTPGTTNGVTLVPSAATAGAITPAPSTAAENNHVLKSSAGSVYSAAATNLTTTPGFLVLINATTAPADGAITPLACAPLPASGSASVNYGDFPGAYSTGIVAVVSSATTCFTKTTGVITAFLSGQVK